MQSSNDCCNRLKTGAAEQRLVQSSNFFDFFVVDDALSGVKFDSLFAVVSSAPLHVDTLLLCCVDGGLVFDWFSTTVCVGAAIIAVFDAMTF